MPKKTEETTGYTTREIPGLACLFLALIVFLALVSHHPGDPSMFSYSTVGAQTQVYNYIGLFGAYVSALFIDLLGLSAFWIVLALLILAWRFFRGRSFGHSWVVALGVFLLLFTAASAFSLMAPRLQSVWPQTPGGGVLGDVMASAMLHAFNPVGAILVVVLLGLIALILATGLSVISAARMLGRSAVRAKTGLDAAQARRREKDERAKRLKEVLAKQQDRKAPTIKDRPALPAPAPEPPPRPKQEQFEFMVLEGPYTLPPLDLLDEPEKGQGGMSRDSLMANARLLEKKLGDFSVEGEVVEVATGPVITMYEYQPAPGVKISKVAGLADDLAMNMRALAIRIVAPLPGKPVIGIEIPNPKRETVYLKDIIASPAYTESPSPLTLVMGVDIMGNPEVADLQRMPHLLIAGATGAGKSVALNAMIMSILLKARPDQVRFLMIDPKRIELAQYNDLPHLIYPVISDPKDANQALKWAVADMEDRYRLLAEKGVRNIESYNRKVLKERSQSPQPPKKDAAEDGEAGSDHPALPEPLPYTVIIIDELADLMMVSAREVEESITRLAQMARAAGIHLILATQRPSVDVLTGVIKANLPTRVSFQVSSKVDSRTILDAVGAEKLLGAGDMLFLPPGAGKLRRIHGAYVSDAEVRRITEFIKVQQPPNYLDELRVSRPGAAEGEGDEDEYDEKYDEAVELVTAAGRASISLIQRHLRVGYNRAARMIELMERDGIVGPADGARPRQVLVRDLSNL